MFILIFIIVWNYIFSILWSNKNPITFFYEEPNETLDVVYIGASNVLSSFNTTLAYYLYGYTTGMLSCFSQPFVATKYLLKEAKKYQKPKLYVIDIARLADDVSYFSKENIRTTTDAMKFSLNRIDSINELLKYKNVNQNEYINFYFSFLTYHNAWKSIGSSKFNNSKYYKGYLFNENTIKAEIQKEFIWQEEVNTLPEENKNILQDLISYIKFNDLQVLFVVPPRYFAQKNNKRLNDAINIIKENDLSVINFNTLKDFKLDFDKELNNSSHINVYGATKFTQYLAKYLKEHYNLADHRNDEKYSSWQNEYERFKKDFKKITNKEFNDILLGDE